MSTVPKVFLTMLLLSQLAFANEHGHDSAHESAPTTHTDDQSAEHAGTHADAHAEAHAGEEPAHKSPSAPGKVAAVDAKKARPIRTNELIQTAASGMSFVDNNNVAIELAPHSVAEFREKEGFYLLRGSAHLESRGEATAQTASAAVTYAGAVVISYDHKERSTSAFVLEGQARIYNRTEDSESLRLDRFRGATMVVGEVIPQLIRQLDVGSLDEWLKGYAWADAQRGEWLRGVPDGSLAIKPEVAPHLETVKLENYFSAIDADDEVAAPDYYEKKFADPDKTVAEANSVKEKSKNMKPEEAALISLPSTKIDLEFNLPPTVMTLKQKQKETAQPEPKHAERSLASVKPVKMRKAAATAEQGDPEISGILNRLRNIRSQEVVVSPQMELKPISSDTRGPASVESSPVPDSVYDYSQNF